MGVDLTYDSFSAGLVREAPDAIIYAASDGRIRFWNHGAERIFGFAEAEAVGQTLDIIIPEHLRERHWKGFMRTMRTGETRYGAGDVLEVPALRKDGSRISVEFSMVMFRGADRTLIGIAVILRDVTRRFNEMKALREQVGLRARPSWH